jgi:hypothetical protein
MYPQAILILVTNKPGQDPTDQNQNQIKLQEPHPEVKLWGDLIDISTQFQTYDRGKRG